MLSRLDWSLTCLFNPDHRNSCCQHHFNLLLKNQSLAADQNWLQALSAIQVFLLACLCCPIAAEHHESSSAEQDPRGGAGARQNAAQRHAHRQTWRRPDDQGLHPGSHNATAVYLTFCANGFSYHGVYFQSRFLFLMTLVPWPCNILTPSSKGTTCRSHSSTRVCPKSSPSYPR